VRVSTIWCSRQVIARTASNEATASSPSARAPSWTIRFRGRFEKSLGSSIEVEGPEKLQCRLAERAGLEAIGEASAMKRRISISIVRVSWLANQSSGILRLNGEGGIRTRDTTIFSRVLYQLSYLAATEHGIGARIEASVRPARLGRLIAFGRAHRPGRPSLRRRRRGRRGAGLGR
jgi:hypothetical protein